MKVGISLNMLTKEGRSDASVVAEHLALGDLAEPLGFDSVFALEHHFTGYAMSPSPTQLLSYIAGRTKRMAAACSASGAAPPAWSTRASASPWKRRGRDSSKPPRSWSRR